MGTFLAQCPDTLQNIHFLEDWHPTSLGLSAGENVNNVSHMVLFGLIRYMCGN